MLRNSIKARFCVSNKDPIHVKNAQNDHYKKMFQNFKQKSQTQIRGNFQKHFYDKQYLDKCQIQTRILKILYDSQLVERLDKFEFSQDLRRDLQLDSLNITVLLTQIEHQFTTVFQDRIFETARNLEQIVTLLVKDPKIF